MTDKISSKSEVIEWLRFFCVVCVVYLHAGIPFTAEDLISCHNGFYDTLRILISHGFCRVAIPVFFTISGYLFFKGLQDWNTAVWKLKLKRRISTLLIPYILWTVISVLFTFVTLKHPSLSAGKHLFSINAFWDTGTGLPQNYPLWFIRNLMLLNILAPVFYFYIKHTQILGLSILFLLFFFNWWPHWPGFEAVGFFFYSFGAFLSISGNNLADICKKYRWIAAIISLPLLMIMVLSYGNRPSLWDHSHRLFPLIGTIAVIGCAAFLYEKRRIRYNEFLSDSAFFIFAAHGTIALPIIQSCLRRLISSTESYALILKYLTAPLLTILLLLLCHKLFMQLLPKTTGILTGGRAGNTHSTANPTDHTLLL